MNYSVTPITHHSVSLVQSDKIFELLLSGQIRVGTKDLNVKA